MATCGGGVDFVGASAESAARGRGRPSSGAPSAAAKPRKSETVKSRKEKRALPAVTSVRNFFSKKVQES